MRKLENLFGHITTLSIDIDPSATVQHVKALIASHLHLPDEQFTLKKVQDGNKVTDMQLDLEDTAVCAEAGLLEGATLFLQYSQELEQQLSTKVLSTAKSRAGVDSDDSEFAALRGKRQWLSALVEVSAT